MKLQSVFWLFAFMIFSSDAFSAEKCFVEGQTQDYPADFPDCYFYQGTEAFRAKEYDVSREKWEALLALEGIEEIDPELAMLANSNLGYLNFWGLGGVEDAKAAVAYLKTAAAMGGREAHYHLCNVYGYSDSTVTNPAKARLHCLLAKTIYEAVDASNDEVRRHLEDIDAQIDFYGFKANDQ